MEPWVRHEPCFQGTDESEIGIYAEVISTKYSLAKIELCTLERLLALPENSWKRWCSRWILARFTEMRRLFHKVKTMRFSYWKMYCIAQNDKKKNKLYLSLLENISYYYKHQYFLQIKKGDLGESPHTMAVATHLPLPLWQLLRSSPWETVCCKTLNS